MAGQILVLLLIVLGVLAVRAKKTREFEIERKNRGDYYRDVYLKSDAWQRKRYVGI